MRPAMNEWRPKKTNSILSSYPKDPWLSPSYQFLFLRTRSGWCVFDVYWKCKKETSTTSWYILLLLLSRMPLLLCWKGLLWVRGRAVNCKISSPHSPPSELWVWELNTLSFSEAQFFGQNWWRLDDENVKKIFFSEYYYYTSDIFFKKIIDDA